jgi:threonine/homoserine/homoserine lactone efflux protein
MIFFPNPLIIPVGFVIGVLIALPIGPTNLLALQRAVERGFFGGLAAGLGITIGDGLIALAAAVGVNAISGAVKEYRTAIQILGGLALMGAGAKLYLTVPRFATSSEAERATLGDYVWDIPQLFFLTITNPGAVLGLIAIFGGVSSFVEVDSYVDVVTMVGAIMGGSFCYWLVVSRLISGIRHTLDEVWMARINKIAGLVLIGFGGLLIAEMVLKRLRLW